MFRVEFWIHLPLVRDLVDAQEMLSVASIVISAFYIFVGIPVCICVLIFLLKEKRLHTHCNGIIGVGIMLTSLGTMNFVWIRVMMFPGVFWISEKTREAVWKIQWWISSVIFRISLNSYLMLALVRYCTVCLPNSARLHQMVKGKATWKHCLIYSALNLVASLVYVTLLWILSPDSWEFSKIQLDHLHNTISLIQDNDDASEAEKIPEPPCFIILFHLAQLTLTFGVYCKILHTTYSATLNLVRGEGMSEPAPPHCQPKPEEKSSDSSMVCHIYAGDNCFIQLPEPKVRTEATSCANNPTNRSSPAGQPPVPEVPEPPDPPERRWSNDSKGTDSRVDEIVLDEVGEVKPHRAEPEAAPGDEAEAGTQAEREGSRPLAIPWCQRLWLQLILPIAVKCPQNMPRDGIRKVNIPLTDSMFCIADDDLQCAASLLLQLLVLIASQLLTMYILTFQKKIIDVKDWVNMNVGYELLVFLSVLADPLTCLLLSSNFRQAFSRRAWRIIEAREPDDVS